MALTPSHIEQIRELNNYVKFLDPCIIEEHTKECRSVYVLKNAPPPPDSFLIGILNEFIHLEQENYVLRSNIELLETHIKELVGILDTSLNDSHFSATKATSALHSLKSYYKHI